MGIIYKFLVFLLFPAFSSFFDVLAADKDPPTLKYEVSITEGFTLGSKKTTLLSLDNDLKNEPVIWKSESGLLRCRLKPYLYSYEQIIECESDPINRDGRYFMAQWNLDCFKHHSEESALSIYVGLVGVKGENTNFQIFCRDGLKHFGVIERIKRYLQ